ncbi:MAG: spore germination protein GerW family protein [Actinoallomurus sp.]
MTVPEIPAEPLRQAEESAAGPAAALIERLAEKLGGKASVSAVFGEPVVSEGITIIPVAKAGFGVGAGVGGGKRSTGTAQGGGGGGGVSAAPLGYIEIKDGNAVFTPIRDPMAGVLVPLAALGAATAAVGLVRGLIRSRGRGPGLGRRFR